jgi:uncharacterized protein YukE
MSRPADGGDNPYQASTDFEEFNHSQMLDMIQNADPGKVTALAHKLDSVSTQTEKIGTDLQTHMSKIEWKGQAGDAFRDWGSRVASATLTLSDYSSTASVFLFNAGQVLSDVQRDMPKVPNLAYETVQAYRKANNIQGPFSDTTGVTPDHLDGTQGPYAATPTAAQYKSAQTNLENARSSAVDQMNKLGQAYNMATDVISKAQEPTFPPAPNTIMPARPKDRGDSTYVPDGVTGTDANGKSGGTSSTGRLPLEHLTVPTNNDLTPNDPSRPPSFPHQPLPPAHVSPDSGLHLDSLPPMTTPPPAPTLPALPTFPTPTPPVVGPPPMPMPVPPPTVLGRAPNLGPTGFSKLPDEVPPLDPRTLAATRSAIQQETEGLTENLSPTGYSPSGGRLPLNGRMPVPEMGEKPPVPAPSLLPGPGTGGTAGGRRPGDSTITGGRRRIAGEVVEPEEGAIPRGTVVGGGFGGSQGRSGLIPMSPNVGEQPRPADERRRAGEEEPEGVVGGTPARQKRRARRNAKNFTSGGSGLGGERDESTDGPSEETPQVGE